MFNHLLWTAIVTPMNSNGSIDYPTFSKLLKRQKEANNAIVLLGSTGEALALSLEDRQEIVRFSANENISVPIMVGVGGANLSEQKSWITYCESFEKIKSFLLPCPLYSKPGIEGQTLWFKELLDHTNKPSMLYNVPSRTGIKLFQEVVERLSKHKNFWALKEASGSLDELKKYNAVAGKVQIFSGEDGLIVEQAQLGIKGLVSVAANIWPKETALYVSMALEEDSSKLKEVWSLVIDTLFMQSNPIPAKVLMKMNGTIPCATLRLPLTELEIKDKSPLEKADKIVTDWYKKERK
jgi:4-hydroxy-tetrahydrodipicolinate synthase